MFKIGCYLIVQAPFINLRNIWEDTDRSIIFLRKLWLFLCAGTMSACFSSLGNFEERIESLMSSHVYFAKKSTFFFSRLVLISSFCAAFFGSRLWKVFWLLRCHLTKLKNWELFLSLISLILGWPLYLPSILKIESFSLYPLLGIFKIGMLIKYSLNFLAIWSWREIILSSSNQLLLECFVTFLDRNGLTVFQNVLLSINIFNNNSRLNSPDKKFEKIVNLLW